MPLVQEHGLVLPLDWIQWILQQGMLHSSHTVVTHSTKIVISVFLVFELREWKIVSTTADSLVGRLIIGCCGD